MALPLPKGSDIVLQMHFHLTGKPEVEQATDGIYFGDQAPERRLFTVPGAGAVRVRHGTLIEKLHKYGLIER